MDRRRTIALSQDGPLGNAGSGIPVPGSTMKKPALRAPAARMSMAPGGGGGMARGSVMSAGNGNGTGGGGGIGMSQDAGLRRSTLLPGASGRAGGAGVGYGVTPQSNRMMGGAGSVRRQSNYPSAGRPSILPPAGSQAMRELRPIRTQAFQQSCREKIESFYVDHRSPVAVTDRVLTSPTQKQFFDMFRWLISTFIDPCYSWLPPKAAKNVDSSMGDDIMAILRDLRYPALDGISKTALTAAGNEKTWPVLLAMLSWLVDLCRAQDMWQDPAVISDPLLTPASELPIDHPMLEDRLFWDYVSSMYVQWFRGEGEDFPEAQNELADAYEKIQQASVEEGDRLEAMLQKRTVEMNQLQAQEPPLKTLEDEYVRLMSDKTKFIAFIELHKVKAEKIKQGTIKARSIIADNETQIETVRAELATIEAAVLAQNLSPDEVQRMNHERDTLGRQLEELRQKIAEASQYSYDQEMSVTRSMDKFEALLSDYTSLGHSIGTIPPVSEGLALGPGGVDYTIDLDLGVDDLAEVQSAGQRLRAVIRPSLVAFGDGFRADMADVVNGNIQLDDELDRLGQSVERQKEEAANLEMKLSVVNEQADDAKNRLTSETAETHRKIGKLEYEVSQILKNTQRGLQDITSQMETTRIEYNEIRHKTAALQDSISKELMHHIEVIVSAKQHTERQLQGIRATAEAR